MIKIKEAFENIWKVKILSKKFEEKDKRKYYELFLDGYGRAIIDKEILELNSNKEQETKLRRNYNE